MSLFSRRQAVRMAGITLLASAPGLDANAATNDAPAGSGSRKPKILIVVSSHDRKGQDLVAGFWFPELTHPTRAFAEAGVEFDIASPRGGLPPFDGFDLKNADNSWFWIQPEMRNRLANSLALDNVNPAGYEAVMLVGGHGPMWDFARNARLHDIVRTVYERGGIVSAICHGPAGLLDLRLTDGSSLIAGRKLTSFTNEEEVSRQYDKLIPFELESALKAQKARFEAAGIFQCRVVVDGRLVTGQNPASAKHFGEAVVAALKARTA